MSTTAEGGKLGRCNNPLNMSETRRAWDQGGNDWAEEGDACSCTRLFPVPKAVDQPA